MIANDGLFYANEVRKRLDCDIEEKTVLFIESYIGRLHGDVFSVLQKMLNDPQFKDWTFFWTVWYADRIPDEFQETVRDSRIRLISKDSLGFLHALEVSQIIVTGMVLPRYYNKHQDQKVIGIFLEYFYQMNNAITKRRAMIQQTFSNLDILYLDNPTGKSTISLWNPIDIPYQVIDGSPLRHSLKSAVRSDVVVSLSNEMVGNIFAVLETKFKNILFICIEHQKEKPYFRVPYKKWDTYKDENAPEVLDHVGSDFEPICQTLKEAKILITDKEDDMKEALLMHVPCIFITRDRASFQKLQEANTKSLIFVDNWELACEELSHFFQYELEKNINDSISQSTVLEDMDKLIDAILEPIAHVENEKEDDVVDLNEQIEIEEQTARSELLVMSPDVNQMIWKILKYYKPDADLSVLFTGSGQDKVWENKCGLDERIKLFLKFGACAQAQDGTRTPDILSDEWKRLLGNHTYDTIYSVDLKERFWQRMLKVAPANKVIRLQENRILNTIIKGLDNPSLRNVEVKSIRKVYLGRNKYYVIGKQGDRQYYLKFKQEIVRPVFVFVNAVKELAYIQAYIDKQEEERTYFFFDPMGYMRQMDILKQENVYWLPMKQLPVKLFLCAETILTSKEAAVRKIAKYLGKEVKSLYKIKINKKPNNFWGLLAIDSVDDIMNCWL